MELEHGKCNRMMQLFIVVVFLIENRNGYVRPGGAVPREEHARVLGAEDLGHRRRHPTETGAARPEREEHPPQRQPPLRRQYVRRYFFFRLFPFFFCYGSVGFLWWRRSLLVGFLFGNVS